MIVVDTSAIVAIFRDEEDASAHARAISEDADPLISAATVVEASIVLRSLKRIAPARAEEWLTEFLGIGGIRIEPVSPEQADLARNAHLRFGRGTGHPAALNYGDCFAYALAKAIHAPLLFKGTAFRATDVEAVV